MLRLEDFVTRIKNTHTGNAVVEEASKLSTQIVKELKKSSAADLETAFAGLEFPKHAHGMAILLGAKSANSNCNLTQILQQIDAFFGACGTAHTLPRTLDAHQIYVLCRNVTERVIQDNCARLAIDLMARAIGLIAENSHQLTEIHHLLLWLCLESQHFKPAFEMLETNLYEIVPTKNFDLQACLMYYYYGSIILARHKFFISALHYVATIFHIPGVPAMASQSVIDAYKKYILLAILAKENVVALPRAFVSHLETHLKKHLGPYLLLQDQFYSDTFDARALDEVVEKNIAVFTNDGNKNLILNVVRRYKTKELLKFAKVFENLEVSVVLERLGLPDIDSLESHLLDMYPYGDRIGRLDESKAAVFFIKKADSNSAEHVVSALQTSVAEVQNIMEIMSSVEVDILSDPEYLRKSIQGGDGGISREDIIAMTESLGSSANGAIASRSGRRGM